MTILVTNDDGITSGGIRALIEVAQEFGEVVVVAPDKPQSAMGHAITIHHPLRLAEVNIFQGVQRAFACSGTPVDCVKLAVDKIIGRKPDLCLSGINHGANSSINVIYSGTLSAAMEASLERVPAIGFSLLNYSVDANMEAAKHYARIVIAEMLAKGVPHYHLLNVNIPDLPLSQIKGIKICRQAKGNWVEEFSERLDPQGRKYYWLTGEFVSNDPSEDCDIYALDNGYVSIVPVQHDLTAYDDIAYMKSNWKL